MLSLLLCDIQIVKHGVFVSESKLQKLSPDFVATGLPFPYCHMLPWKSDLVYKL